jgi:hypothetical protein
MALRKGHGNTGRHRCKNYKKCHRLNSVGDLCWLCAMKRDEAANKKPISVKTPNSQSCDEDYLGFPTSSYDLYGIGWG